MDLLIITMRKIDYLSLDGYSLLAFITVLDRQSVSKTAAPLRVTQTSVSHTLGKLPPALGDPLFVR